jgi:hypothetical protein
MRLLIIGRFSGELVTASKIAISRGAAVTQADSLGRGCPCSAPGERTSS